MKHGTMIKKTRLVPYAYAMLVALFMVAGCDPPSNNDNPPSPIPANSNAYIYKGMLVGSTGHITMEITPKDSTGKKGHGKATMTMDGKERVLTQTGDKVANFQPGKGLSNAHFSNSEGDTVTISLNKENGVDTVFVSIAGHKSPIAVAMFEENKGGEKVSVYEGTLSLYSGHTEHEDSLVERSTFNVVIKGEDAKIIQKGVKITEKSCLTPEAIKRIKLDLAKKKPPTVSGKVKKLSDSKYQIAFEGGPSQTLSLKKDGKKLQWKHQSLPVCIGKPDKKMLNPLTAYHFTDSSGQPVTGYKLKGGGSVSCKIRKYPLSTCEEVPAGKIPLTEEGRDIISKEYLLFYYMKGRALEQPSYSTLVLTEVL